MIQGPGVQKTFRLSSHTPEQFNVMPRTKHISKILLQTCLVYINYLLNDKTKKTLKTVKTVGF